MSDPTLSDIDFEYKMAGVRTTLDLMKNIPSRSYFPSTQIMKNHNFSQKMKFVSLLGLLAGAAIGALVTCACTDPAGSH